MQLQRKILGLLFTIALILPVISFSQEEMVLTLDKSVTIALEQNPEIKIAEKELAKAKTGVWEAYSTILPQLNGSVNFQHAWEIQKNVIPNFLKIMMGSMAPPDAPDYVEIAFGLKNTFSYGVTLTQPLYLGGAGLAGIQIGHAAKRAAVQSLEAKRQNLIFHTVNAFYTCLLVKEIVTVQKEALAQSEANLDIVVKKYNVGAASGFDKMRAEVEVANLKPEIISTQNNYQSALTGLRTVLGLDKDVTIKLKGQFEYSEDIFGEKTLQEIQNMALLKRPEILAFSEQKYMARKGISIARSNFLPKLFFQTDYSYLAMEDSIKKFSRDDFNKGFTSAISLQIPLFTGFKSVKQYQKAKLDYRMTLDTEKQVNDGILAEAEVAYNKFHEAKEKYLSANQSVGLAEEALRLANMMYEEGANTQLDVLNSQVALIRARLNRITSLYEYQMACYQLRKVTGTLKQIL